MPERNTLRAALQRRRLQAPFALHRRFLGRSITELAATGAKPAPLSAFGVGLHWREPCPGLRGSAAPELRNDRRPGAGHNALRVAPPVRDENVHMLHGHRRIMHDPRMQLKHCILIDL
jgi:hypothetical protein